jgi:regulator of sigma E protease
MTDSFVNEVVSGSAADHAKIQKNDVIVGFNNITFTYFSEFKSELKKSAGKEITLNILRDAKKMALQTRVGKNGKLGFGLASKKQKSYEVVNKLSITEAFPEAVKESWQLLIYNVKQFKLILRPKTEAYKHVKSPVGIARALPDSWNWEFIWNFTALFSIGLAFMNLLPIPSLDGGHALFTIAEMVTGRTLSEKAMGHVQTAGMIILLTLMALTFGKDIYQLIVDKHL